MIAKDCKGKKNICIIGPVPPPMNGQSKAVETIIKSQRCNEAFNMNIINLSSKIGVSGKIRLYKIRNVIRVINKLKHFQAKQPIDVYYLTIAQSVVGCLRDIVILHQIYKRKNAKVILHLHGGKIGDFYEDANYLLKHLIRYFYSKADNFVVLSKSIGATLVDIIPNNKMKIIENCVEDEFILQDYIIKQKLKSLYSKKCFSILYLSNMIKEKGYMDALYSAQILKNKNMNFCFSFAGVFTKDSEEREFLNYIIKNDLQDHIKYLGAVYGDQKKQLLLENDIFVLPTLFSEGQPISILEAMSAGMPVITTKRGGIPDIIREGKNGIFVQNHDSEGIAEAIISLSNSLETMVAMGRNNRASVMEKYRETHYIENIINLFQGN